MGVALAVAIVLGLASGQAPVQVGSDGTLALSSGRTSEPSSGVRARTVDPAFGQAMAKRNGKIAFGSDEIVDGDVTIAGTIVDARSGTRTTCRWTPPTST